MPIYMVHPNLWVTSTNSLATSLLRKGKPPIKVYNIKDVSSFHFLLSHSYNKPQPKNSHDNKT